MGRSRVVAVALFLGVLAACTVEEPEVLGERRSATDAPVATELTPLPTDDDTTAPATGTATPSDDATGDGATGEEDAADAGDADQADGDGDATDAGQDDDATAGGDAGAGTTDDDAPSDADAQTGEPTTVASPAPPTDVMQSGQGDSTNAWFVDGDGDQRSWIEISQTRESADGSAPPLVVGLLPVDDPDGTASARTAVCAATLQASSDARLEAIGEVTIHTVVDDEVRGRARVNVDVILDPGERLDLPEPQGVRVTLADTDSVTCSTVFDRR